MAVIGAIAAVASVGVGILALKRGEGERVKAIEAGKGLRVFYERLPYVIIFVIIMVIILVIYARPAFIFGGS